MWINYKIDKFLKSVQCCILDLHLFVLLLLLFPQYSEYFVYSICAESEVFSILVQQSIKIVCINLRNIYGSDSAC